MTFSRRDLLFVCRRTSRRQLGRGTCGVECQLRVLAWFSPIWSLFQFLVIIDYFLGKKHIESTMLCCSLAKHARFCEPGVVTFSRRHIYFLCRRTTRRQWEKLLGFSSVKNIDFTQSNLKSDSIFSYYWLFFGKKHIESMQWPNRNGSC